MLSKHWLREDEDVRFVWDSRKIDCELRQIMAACGRKSKKPAYVNYEHGFFVYAEFRYGLYARKRLSACFYQNRPTRIGILSASEDTSSEVARILYKIGQPPELIAEHYEILSCHEQLELRNEMPRQFWPPEWLDEENRRNEW